jgi:creatinine amidohydrolase
MKDWCRSLLWGELTRAEILKARDDGAIPVLPIGAVEQHSDHLPVDTDASSAFGVALRAAERTSRAKMLVLPLQNYGFSPHHKTWPGTITLSSSTLTSLIHDLAESLHMTGFRRMLVTNGHGGNEGPLLSACNAAICDGIGIGYVNYFNPGRAQWLPSLPGSHRDVGHGCAFETSIQMALHPHDRERITACVQGLEPRLDPPFSRSGSLEDLRRQGLNWAWLFPPGDFGYYGDPAAAVRGNPDLILDLTVTALANFFDDFADANLVVGTPNRLTE